MRRKFDISHWTDHFNSAGHQHNLANLEAERGTKRKDGKKNKIQTRSNMLKYFLKKSKKTVEGYPKSTSNVDVTYVETNEKIKRM